MNNTLFFIISSIDFILKNNNFDWVRVARPSARVKWYVCAVRFPQPRMSCGVLSDT